MVELKRIFRFEIIVFSISIYILYFLLNFFYLSTESPDYIFYKDYFYYFFQENEITGRENGIIYFYLVSLFVKLQEHNITPISEIHVISNSIQITNLVLYLVGLVGLYKLLIFKKFKREPIIFSFSILNLMPFTFSLVATMKPEILAFSMLPWSLLIIELYLKSDNILYVYLGIPPNLLIISSKATIIAPVVLIYLTLVFIYKNKIVNKKVLIAVLIFIILMSFILFENYISNGYFILDHNPGGGGKEISTEDQVQFEFLYNINLKEIIQKPYRHNHADSFIGLILLDTFGDYFQWYSNNTKTLFTVDELPLQGIWYFGNVKELLALLASILLYFYIGFFMFKFKNNFIYYLLPFFGYFVFLILVFARRPYFDTSKSELFKTHYFSYLLAITFVFVMVELFKQKSLSKYLIIIFVLLVSFFQYGFPKTEYSNTLTYIKVKNSISPICEFNSLFIPSFSRSNDCKNYSQNICQTDILLLDVRYLTSNLHGQESIYPFEITNGKNIVKVKNESECNKLVEEGYIYESLFSNKLLIPFVNIAYFLASIISLFILSILIREKQTNIKA